LFVLSINQSIMKPHVFGSWTPPATLLGDDNSNNKVIPKPEPPSPTCGGTGHLLPMERQKASFDPFQLTLAMDGSPKQVMHRRWLWAAGEAYDNSGNYFMTREQRVARHVETFIGIHKKFAEEGYRPEADDVLMMSNVGRNQGAYGLHFGAFTTTIASQGTMEQVMEWVPAAYSMKIFGALGQTECGHGGNVRALQTIAEYDPSTEEFVMNTPTLPSIKWWPGGLGKSANFAVIYANLIIKGEEKGFHSFIVQLRDENHKPLPGIEVGEVGEKIGDNTTETGFLRLTNVRIPRDWLLAKNQTVAPDGTYTKNPKTAGSKVQYTTMLTIRSGLVMSSGYRLAQAVTIASRYSCVRKQGFVDTSPTTKRDAEEFAIAEYQNQQYRLFKQLALSYAFVWTGKNVAQRFRRVMAALTGADEDASELPEMHAISAGLKALCTFEGAAGMEECRKLCGGHGVLLYSGVAQMALDYTTYCTAEGDRILLELQTARYLVKQLTNARAGKPLSGLSSYLAPCKDRGYDPSPTIRCTASHSSSFMNLDLLLGLFRGRALNAVVEAGDRLETELHKSGGRFDPAWNACAVDMVTASRAHCYFEILHNFVAVVTPSSSNDSSERPFVKDDKARAAQAELCRLFALQNILEDSGSFDLTRPQKLAIKEAIRILLIKIRPDIIALTDAFEFPDNCLNSALGKYDGNVYEALYEAARNSPLNKQDPFPGYEEYLRPNLDLEFIAEKKKLQRVGMVGGGKL
jgi:acyl-CoA oxidase